MEWHSPELYDLDRDRERLRLRLTRTGVEGLRGSKKSPGGGPSAGSHAGGKSPRSSGCAGSPLRNNVNNSQVSRYMYLSSNGWNPSGPLGGKPWGGKGGGGNPSGMGSACGGKLGGSPVRNNVTATEKMWYRIFYLEYEDEILEDALHPGEVGELGKGVEVGLLELDQNLQTIWWSKSQNSRGNSGPFIGLIASLRWRNSNVCICAYLRIKIKFTYYQVREWLCHQMQEPVICSVPFQHFQLEL